MKTTIARFIFNEIHNSLIFRDFVMIKIEFYAAIRTGNYVIWQEKGMQNQTALHLNRDMYNSIPFAPLLQKRTK